MIRVFGRMKIVYRYKLHVYCIGSFVLLSLLSHLCSFSACLGSIPATQPTLPPLITLAISSHLPRLNPTHSHYSKFPANLANCNEKSVRCQKRSPGPIFQPKLVPLANFGPPIKCNSSTFYKVASYIPIRGYLLSRVCFHIAKLTIEDISHL